MLSQAADAELSESFLFGSTHGRNLVHASETGDQASNCSGPAWTLPGFCACKHSKPGGTLDKERSGLGIR